MVVARERFLDDSSRFRLVLELRSGASEMHSLLSGAPAEVVEQVGDALTRALDEIADALRGLPSSPPPHETTSFGCGT